MTLEELIETYPEAETYFKNMPEELKTRYTIRKFPPGTIIHQKDYPLDYFGIVCSGNHRVINEFENGNVFMIEKNEAIDFIGEVTILAEKPLTSVSIETLTECVVFMLSREDFEMWIAQDIHLLRLVAHKASAHNIEKKGEVILRKTREGIREELGMTVKTINRTIAKLKEDGLIDTRKGKVVMSLEQYQMARDKIGYYVS